MEQEVAVAGGPGGDAATTDALSTHLDPSHPVSGRTKALLGVTAGALAVTLVLAATGPSPEVEASSTIRRMGGPCLQLEKWGLFGWSLVGRTSKMTQATNGDWQPAGPEPSCQDVDDSLVLVRLPSDSGPGTYRICGLADDEGCLTIRATPFEGSGPGP